MAFGLDMALALLFQSDVATFCRKKGVYVGRDDVEAGRSMLSSSLPVFSFDAKTR